MSARVAALLLFAAASVACGRIPTTHYYVLDLPQAQAKAGGGGATLEVGIAPFAVDAPYDQDRIVYRPLADRAEVGFYSYHRWAAPLSRMLPAAVAEKLGGDLDGRVEPTRAGVDYDAVVGGRLLAIEEIDLEDSQRIRVELSLYVRDRQGTRLWSGDTAAETEIRAGDVDEVVEAMRGVLGSALEKAREPMISALGRAAGGR